MAEFCLDCYNQYVSDEELTVEDVVLDIDLCEGCGALKPCVLKEKMFWHKIKRRIKQARGKNNSRHF